MKSHYNKKGLSQIIASMLMIILVFVASAIVFNFVKNLTSDKIENSEACFGNFGKITIDNRYTCYNSTSNEVQVFISVGDISIDSILTSVSSNSGSKSFEISNGVSNSIREYDGNYGENITIPGKNSGKTYIINLDELGLSNAESVSIAPIISGKQCEVSDSVSQIDDCLLLS